MFKLDSELLAAKIHYNKEAIDVNRENKRVTVPPESILIRLFCCVFNIQQILKI